MEVTYWDPSVWQFVLALTILFGAMLLANLLRRTIRPLRRTLIPSSVLAGFLVLLFAWIWKLLTQKPLLDALTLEALTYHGLGLGVTAMTFRNTGKTKNSRRDVFNSGLLTVSTYLLQGVIGLGITLGLFYLIGSWAASGILLPMGFGQGPGNAYGWGLTYQTATEYPAFPNGATFGAAVAAMGFISAAVGGVFYLREMKNKGKLRIVEDAEEIEDLSAEMVTEKGEIGLTESLDKLTIQFGLVLLAYGLAYLFNYAVSLGLDALGGFAAGTVKPLFWNFNFLVAMLFVAIIKGVMAKLKKSGLQRREYVNNFMMERISALLFDLMVVASIASIRLEAFKQREFLLPLLAICIAGGVATYFYVRFVTRKLFPEYENEQFLVFYGMLTGTNCTGFALLREVDPLYKTPAAHNLIYQNLWAVVFGAPMLLLLGVVAVSLQMTWITLGALAAMLAAIVVLLFRSRIFKKKGKK